MTTPDLVRQILAAIEETERLARAVVSTINPTTGEWVAAGEHGTEIRDSRGHLVVKHSWPDEIAHITRHDPASVLRRCTADRALIAEVTGWKHVECEDGWYSCSQAPSWNDPTPGAGCANEDRAGQPCDCGLESRQLDILRALADSYGVAPATSPEHS